MEDRFILLCDGSIDGIMSAVYEGFEIRNKSFKAQGRKYSDNISICVEAEPDIELFAEYINVATDYDKSYKTAYSIRKRLGPEVYEEVLKALCHYDRDRAACVFGFLIRGFPVGPSILEHMGDKYVMRTIELARKAGKESHLFKGFVRFKDVEGSLYSVIEPKCDVIPLIGGHFAQRYPNENWVLYDKKRKKAALHPKGGEWVIASGSSLDGDAIEKLYGGEDDYGHIWEAFLQSTYTKERKNERCQNNLIPKWYRANMPEFTNTGS